MSPPPAPDAGAITTLLQAHKQGDALAFDRLVALVYGDLKRLARRRLAGGGRQGTLDTTALVHETYLVLAKAGVIDWQDRGHFYAVAARAMRFVIADFAKRRTRLKRGGGGRDVTLDEESVAVERDAAELLALERALERLESERPRQVRVVECRHFAGLSEEETAEALGVSLRTVQREWSSARTWLRRQLAG